MGNESSKKSGDGIEADAGSSDGKGIKITATRKDSSPSSPEHQPKSNPIQSLMKLKRKKPPPIPAFRRRKLSHAFHKFFGNFTHDDRLDVRLLNYLRRFHRPSVRLIVRSSFRFAPTENEND